MQFYYNASDLKIIGHENPDNNLESLCVLEWKSLKKKSRQRNSLTLSHVH